VSRASERAEFRRRAIPNRCSTRTRSGIAPPQNGKPPCLDLMNALGSSTPTRVKPWMLAGMLAFLPHLIAVVLASAQRPEFSHRDQYLSELGERGSATAFITNYLGIIPTGILLACFGLGVLLRFRADRRMAIAGALIVLHGVLRVAAALFPCDPGCRPLVATHSQTIHNAAATTAFVSLTAALFFAGSWLRAQKRGKAIIVETYSLGAIAIAAQGMLVAAPMGAPGLYQRVALGALQLWVALLAFHLSRRASEMSGPISSKIPAAFGSSREV
jgi:hypothetical membrane protein